ncbi:hypothetical protein [Vibrio harveyi]|uniref:hypothetical protein n=1 Tax=Vibrio harveyi TaxID=669 RepID=UPI003CE8F983
MYLYPYSMAENLLEWFGVDFEDLYNERGGIRREQLKIINRYSVLMGAKSNAYETISRLEKSKNKKDLDFGKNLKRTLTGTLSGQIITSIANSENADKIIVEWMPSSAEEERATHALHYGRKMPIKRAVRFGLGVDYNCQCGFKIIRGQEYVKPIVQRLNKGKLR